MTGPARFDWDVEAIQQGFVDPLYELFDQKTERWRPTLAALLIEAGGRAPERYPAMLAAVELQHLALLLLERLRNGRNIAESTAPETRLPLPVLVTVAYTAKQMASTLVIRHEGALATGTRSWLAYQVSRALYEASAGMAVDIQFAEKEASPRERWHLRLLAPLTFRLPVDCALAALDRHEASGARMLREAASHASIAYRLAMDVLGRRARARGEPAQALHEVPIHWSPLAPRPGETPSVAWRRSVESGLVAEVLSHARRERQEAGEVLATADGPLAATLRVFIEAVVDMRLAEAEEVCHAE